MISRLLLWEKKAIVVRLEKLFSFYVSSHLNLHKQRKYVTNVHTLETEPLKAQNA